MSKNVWSETVTIGPDGTGLVVFRSDGPWIEVELLAVSVRINGTDGGKGSASIYLASTPSEGAFLYGTYSGGGDTATISRVVLGPSEPLCVQWTGAEPGAEARATVHYRPGRLG